MNPEHEAGYAANRLGLTRQLRYSPRSGKSVDVTLSLNGVPVVTVELKNPLSGQTVEDARRQHQRDRDPREPIFEFKRRTLVHFALQRADEEKAELLRGKMQAFRNLYGFLSQIIPCQDSDLERLHVFLRHLAAKLPRRRRGPAYRFDDEVRLQYYRLQKIGEGSIPLREGGAPPLDGPSETGSGLAREETVPLSQLIDVVNERFGADFNQADQLFFDQVVEAAVEDEDLRHAAEVNPEDRFTLVFGNLLRRLFVERMDQNEGIFVRYMNDARFRETVSAWMASEAYRRLRAESAGARRRRRRPGPRRRRSGWLRKPPIRRRCLALPALDAAPGDRSEAAKLEFGFF